MKQYPSITAEIRYDIPVLAFNKLDGSNIRAEWTKKQGFFKFGIRTRLLGTDEKPLGEAIELIKNKYEKDLHDIFVKDRCEKIVCFFEFFGPSSAFGQHLETEDHDVIL